MSIIIHLLGTVLALFLAAEVVDGFLVESLYAAFIVAVILGVIHITLKPLVLLIAFPLQILTLGLFRFVVSAAFIWFVASFVQGFTVLGFMPALLGALIIAAVLWVLDFFF